MLFTPFVAADNHCFELDNPDGRQCVGGFEVVFPTFEPPVRRT